jgi:glycosyltransferase involved in cell wall biosynthesis
MLGPKVSICIPAYKQVLYLRKTLDSIAWQDYTDFEIILSDDSPDDSVEKLVKEYNFGEKLNYYRNTPSLGTPENWNEAMRKAKGEYIKVMHHDDWFEGPGSLKTFVQLLDEKKDADMAFCVTKILNVKTNEFSFNSPTQELINRILLTPAELFFGNFIGAPSATIFRRSTNLFFDNRVKYVVDIDFYIRILQRNNKLAYCPYPLIVNISNWEEQVTHHSMDKETQVGEYALLYNKIRKGLPSNRYLEFFRSLFLKYNVHSLKEFKRFNSEAPRPNYIFSLLIFYLKITGRYSHE